MELFESKVAELQQIIEAEGVKCDIAEQSDVIGSSDELEVDIMDIELSPGTEFYSEPLSAEPEPETLPMEEEPAVEPEVISEEIAVETAAETLSEQVTVETPEKVDDDLPFFEELPAEAEPLQVAEETVSEPVSEPEPVVPAADSAILNDVPPSSDVPVIDAMLDKHAWRTDMPGTAVKDIRSAISLNDRILFINVLFNEDPMSFQNAVMIH